MGNSVKDPDDCVFLLPDKRCNYKVEELDTLIYYNLETKLFMIATPCAGDTSFLRMHHANNLKYANYFNYIWDYVQAAHATRVQTCTKTTLTTLLIMCFHLSLSNYYTFAISIVFGLLKYGRVTMFEINDAMVKNRKEVDAICGKFFF